MIALLWVATAAAADGIGYRPWTGTELRIGSEEQALVLNLGYLAPRTGELRLDVELSAALGSEDAAPSLADGGTLVSGGAAKVFVGLDNTRADTLARVKLDAGWLNGNPMVALASVLGTTSEVEIGRRLRELSARADALDTVPACAGHVLRGADKDDALRAWTVANEALLTLEALPPDAPPNDAPDDAARQALATDAAVRRAAETAAACDVLAAAIPEESGLVTSDLRSPYAVVTRAFGLRFEAEYASVGADVDTGATAGTRLDAWHLAAGVRGELTAPLIGASGTLLLRAEREASAVDPGPVTLGVSGVVRVLALLGSPASGSQPGVEARFSGHGPLDGNLTLGPGATVFLVRTDTPVNVRSGVGADLLWTLSVPAPALRTFAVVGVEL